MRWQVVWHSQTNHVHSILLGERGRAQAIARELGRYQGSVEIIDRALGETAVRFDERHSGRRGVAAAAAALRQP
jgi:hypothetical protein